jgi:formamidopyrimidine-DNA glycosylase
VPELTDVTVYRERLQAVAGGRALLSVRLRTPFVLRTVEPPLSATFARTLVAVHRVGKRLVLEFDEELLLVVHLMIAGRLRWKPVDHPLTGRGTLACFDFEHGTLLFTEVATKKRASMHVVQGRSALAGFDRGGVDVFAASAAQFAEALRRDNRTLKRALCDPTVLSGIGNAYSDEILHAAKLSPLAMSCKLTDDEIARLFHATQATLTQWAERLGAEARQKFPEKVTALRPEMAAHGKYQQPCPVCATPIQRIRYADNETNYCPRCQTGGRILADRSLSRLLGKDFPRTIEELELRRR